jgi:hypothetical protein
MIVNKNMDDSGQLQTQLLECLRSIESKDRASLGSRRTSGGWSFVHSYFVGVGYSTSGARLASLRFYSRFFWSKQPRCQSGADVGNVGSVVRGAVRRKRYLFFAQTKNSLQRSVHYLWPDASLLHFHRQAFGREWTERLS